VNFKAIAEKKFLNIPVLYWALGAAVTLLVLAMRMKPIPETPDTTEPASDPSTEGGLNDPTTADYDGLLPSGTVVVQPATPVAATVKEQTNEEWARAAAEYLMSAEGGSIPPGEAQQAMTLYIRGAELSTVQAGYRDKAIKKLKYPPEPLDTIGTVATPTQAPPQKQFSVFPGKHIVKGGSDNTAAKLATLYYGSANAGLGAAKIGQYNEQFGPLGTTYNVGDVIMIPGWEEPRYWKATTTMRYPKQFADKMPAGTRTAKDIEQLNPGVKWPVAVGASVRVV
jgi:hypothetical protein